MQTTGLLVPSDLCLQHSLQLPVDESSTALSTHPRLVWFQFDLKILPIQFRGALVEKMDVLDCGRTRTQIPDL